MARRRRRGVRKRTTSAAVARRERDASLSRIVIAKRPLPPLRLASRGLPNRRPTPLHTVTLNRLSYGPRKARESLFRSTYPETEKFCIAACGAPEPRGDALCSSSAPACCFACQRCRRIARLYPQAPAAECLVECVLPLEELSLWDCSKRLEKLPGLSAMW